MHSTGSDRNLCAFNLTEATGSAQESVASVRALHPCPSSRAVERPQSAGWDMSPFREGCYVGPHKNL